jgi:hypothetical protein
MMVSKEHEQAIQDEKDAEARYQRTHEQSAERTQKDADERAQAAVARGSAKFVAPPVVVPTREELWRIANTLRPDQGRDTLLRHLDPEWFRQHYGDDVFVREEMAAKGFDLDHVEVVQPEAKDLPGVERVAVAKDGTRFKLSKDGKLGSAEKPVVVEPSKPAPMAKAL